MPTFTIPKPRAMRKRELERLLDLLGELSGQQWIDGVQRDAIAELRGVLLERLDGTD